MKRIVSFVATACLMSCSDTGQESMAVPLYVAGTDASEPILAAGDVPVHLDRADLAFGPLYLCAGAQAGELCETARLEWLESIVVDTTNPTPERAGELIGMTGAVRSYMYDLGLTSLLTRREPLVLPAARDLGGVSLVLEGEADVEGFTVPFAVAIPIQQEPETEQGIPVVRKGTRELFEHVITGGESGLLIRFDHRPWIEGIDFTEVGGATLEPGTRAFRSIRNAVVAGRRPAFQWGFSP